MLFGSKRKAADKPATDDSAPAAAAPNGRSAEETTERQPDKGPDKPANVEQRRRRAAASLRLSAAFAQVVTLLMRSQTHKHLSISDLEWLVLPPLVTGQFRIAKVGSRKAGIAVPAAVVLWASVSSEVDARLSQNATTPIRLRPDEWRSGDIVWLVEAAGDPRVVGQLLKELNDNVFKDREVKVRTREAGSPAVGTLQSVIAKRTQS